MDGVRVAIDEIQDGFINLFFVGFVFLVLPVGDFAFFTSGHLCFDDPTTGGVFNEPAVDYFFFVGGLLHGGFGFVLGFDLFCGELWRISEGLL